MQNLQVSIFYLKGKAESFPSAQHKFHRMLVISVSFEYAVNSSGKYNVKCWVSEKKGNCSVNLYVG